MQATKSDIYTNVTTTIIAAIEAGQTSDKFKMPWSGNKTLPKNALTGKLYRGINVIRLWVQQVESGFTHTEWASYKQWGEMGAQVGKGEKGTTIMFYRKADSDQDEKQDPEEGIQSRLIAKSFTVFNASQVDGYASEKIANAVTTIEACAAADELVNACGADIRIGGNSAYYSPSKDYIAMPHKHLFRDTKTMTAQEGWYSTLLHELTHFTGAESRLNRAFSKRFGDASYAFEELVAELGAAMLCATLGVTNDTRADHAQYIHNWLTILKEDKRAIFTAASHAQKAADYLLSTVTPKLESQLLAA